MKKFFINALCYLGVLGAACIVFYLLFLMLSWSMTWSDTIIALFIFMGCPVVLSAAWGVTVGIGAIPISSKFWLVISELTLLYFAGIGVYDVWQAFHTIDGGWKIALKVIYSLVYVAVYCISGLMLYFNSKEQWS